MQRRLRDQRIIVLTAKDPARLEGADDARDRLKLGTRLRDGLLVNDKRLDKELVRQLFEVAIVCDLGGQKEEPETGVGGLDFVVEEGDNLVDEFEERGEPGLPVDLLPDGERSASHLAVKRRALLVHEA